MGGRSPRMAGASSAYPQGRNTLSLGPLLLPLGQGRAGPGLRCCSCSGAQGGGEQTQPCGPCFHLRASKRCKQTLSLCQAVQAPSSRPQLVLPILLPAPTQKASGASVPQSPPGHAEEGEALPGGGKAGAGPLTCTVSHRGPGRELDAHSHAPSDHRRTFQPRAVLCAMWPWICG